MSTPSTDAVLVDAIRDASHAMPPGQLGRLADIVERLSRFDDASGVQALSAVANPSFRDTALRLLKAWALEPAVSGAAIALALRAAAAARSDALEEETIDAVWTGPTTHHIAVRRTREVLLELIHTARRRLIVVSFAAYKVPEVLRSLSEAASRGVDIRLILETSEDSQGRLSHDAAEAFESARGAASFYVWPADRRVPTEGSPGALHAKAVLADASTAFVTSANLTGHGLGNNMELGLLVRGGPVPDRLTAHFDELIAHGVLRRVD